MRPRIEVKYKEEVARYQSALKGNDKALVFGDQEYSNVMLLPKLSKIVINTSLKEGISNSKLIERAVVELELITGQKAIKTKARRSIANFKLREGNELGAKVTLRRAHMWEFFDRLVSVAIPRIRDFQGINPSGFDGRGNYTLGVTEQIIFPEIRYDEVMKVSGMNITFVTTASNDDEARSMLKFLGMPFRSAK
ncbi:MAG: 50S ribosomal protein L5 [Myxococcota bacterium]|nr:50S ribosomal protein L5 [Myxococcota bacterium]MEC8381146.1 50S ribosomal protein L5 [Myxococcota bacterium]